jgi:hypothetical protein
VKSSKLRRSKAACIPSYAEYRPNTNAAILWNMVTLREVIHGRDRVKEGNKELEYGIFST